MVKCPEYKGNLECAIKGPKDLVSQRYATHYCTDVYHVNCSTFIQLSRNKDSGLENTTKNSSKFTDDKGQMPQTD